MARPQLRQTPSSENARTGALVVPTWNNSDDFQAHSSSHLVVSLLPALSSIEKESLCELELTFLLLLASFSFSIIAHLAIKFPTTSYYYPSSPGFRWVATVSSSSSSSTPTPSSSEAQPTSAVGRWRFSPAGLPSDPHPLSGDKPKFFWWPIFIVLAPFLVAWISYITGSIGEPGDDSYRTFTWWMSGVSLAFFPSLLYMGRDGGALDVHAKRVEA